MECASITVNKCVYVYAMLQYFVNNLIDRFLAKWKKGFLTLQRLFIIQMIWKFSQQQKLSIYSEQFSEIAGNPNNIQCLCQFFFDILVILLVVINIVDKPKLAQWQHEK